jgi:hypothetical protein
VITTQFPTADQCLNRPVAVADIGGYARHDTADPDWRELATRWFQWSSLMPIYRLHGHTSGPCVSLLCHVLIFSPKQAKDHTEFRECAGNCRNLALGPTPARLPTRVAATNFLSRL